MQINQAGIDLIKRFEGLMLEAYRDPVGIWTIGYGHTKSVKPGMEWTEKQAEKMLKKEVAEFAAGVRKKLTRMPNSNELAAMTSLAYNIGLGAFGRSTLLRKFNDGKSRETADQFLRWNKGTVKGQKVVLKGLTRRRQAERDLFLTPTSGATGSWKQNKASEWLRGFFK